MTPSDLANRALEHLDQPRAQIDPLTLAILLAILSAVIQHYVEHCLDRLDHRAVTQPSLMYRGNLWLNCLWAARKHNGNREHAQTCYDALLKMGAGMTEQDLAQLKSA